MKPTLVLTAVDEALHRAWVRWCGDLSGIEVHRGSILEVPCDAVVSPANSFGFMDGGVDRHYIEFFGSTLQECVQMRIREQHHGELLVGQAMIVATGHTAIPYLMVAPTMRVPMRLDRSVNAYLAARAVLLLWLHGSTAEGVPVRDCVKRIAFPGLGTGQGQLKAVQCAKQVRAAIEEVLLERGTFPDSVLQARNRHDRLAEG
jgi:O-acetyl-ADP-ribose deacetylase (regulator of RNase III)